MIQCWVKLGNGGELALPTAISWKFCYGTDTPCDSFFLRCLWERGQEKLLSAACRFCAQWEGERVFTGVVDEFAVICGKDGLYLELSGRGMAALLLDNEAMPAEYQRCTRADIIAGHVAPYGVEAVGGGELPAVSGFTVASGESEWSVVRRYACYYGGAVRRRTTWGTQWVSDPAFLAEGGCARKIITVPNTTGTAAMRYSADYQLKAARRERVRMRITVAGAFLAWPGELVSVELDGFGGNGQYRAAQTEVSCGSEGLTTTLVLGEVDAMI